MQRSWLGRAALVSVPLLVVYLTASGCIEEDNTQFGNPNTLSRQNLPGEAGTPPVLTGCAANYDGGCPSFDVHVYPYLTATGAWKCSEVACHGDVSSPTIACDTPENCFNSLKNIEIDGKPYLPDPAAGVDATNARMLCSLQGICGDKMPRPPGQDPNADELCMIDVWLKCGAPR